ncbi:MBL fold metallo-hydrolase [Paraglaciecola chathamensis]|uniref:Ribonuclease Z n=1 Tax=Paraglaciecola chathamensis TaxID=368405 RepID=A0A8H9LYA7_9ALTE|nr:MBL fold metallo-hydrolase [Paraglaciecola oceanifecundans]GGZ79147.1 ribonuclease Z [Paraglaciecola oceanifecundans]
MLFKKAFSVIVTLFIVASAQANDFSVTLLGTGNPMPEVERFGPSTLVQVKDKTFLFDAGRGVTMRLQQAHIRAPQIDGVFLTHLHSDHITDIDDVWLSGWVFSPFGGRSTAFNIYGPVGTLGLTKGLSAAYDADIVIRKNVEKAPASGIEFVVKEIEQGVIYEEDGIKITAFTVDHGAVKPAFGYRIDYDNRSVIISGDTRYSENLISYSKNTDLLIHEIATGDKRIFEQFPPAKAIFKVHTSPADLLKIVDKVKPKLTVVTHIMILETLKVPKLPLAVVAEMLNDKSGHEIVLGKDLMRFEVTPNGVTTI